MKRRVTELRVLRAVADAGTAYGWQLVQSNGFKKGSVYQALTRLRRRGLLRSEAHRIPGKPGMPIRYYRLTSYGREALKEGDVHVYTAC